MVWGLVACDDDYFFKKHRLHVLARTNNPLNFI